MSRPTVYLTNATSRRAPYRGPGRVWTIMAAPRARCGEFGAGPVAALVPLLDWVQGAKAGTIAMEDYRRWYEAMLETRELAPGQLRGYGRLVEDGDTLICACSRDAAAHGRCHRAWAAPALRAAGWSVVLDGRALP